MRKEINIPETLADITLKQYQTFLKSDQSQDDLLRIFLRLSEQGVERVKAKEIDRMTEHINDLFKDNNKHDLQFVLKGVRMGFIPNLDEITYGENKDITAYIGDWEQIHKAMAVLYRPVKQKQRKQYLIEEYNGSAKYSEFMKDMPLDIVFGALFFFYNLTSELLNCIPNFILKQSEMEMMDGQLSLENGEAIRSLTRSLKETLDVMTKFQVPRYTDASIN